MKFTYFRSIAYKVLNYFINNKVGFRGIEPSINKLKRFNKFINSTKYNLGILLNFSYNSKA